MASPDSSLLPEDDPPVSSPSLDTLVSHLLAAKRSLSCVEHVYHANDLVTATRQALESHTLLTARTIFLQNGCNSQLGILGHVRNHTQSIAHEAALEFQTVIKNLDAAEGQLRGTLDQLKATMVESRLRPDGEPSRSLIDFVDETGVKGLLDTIKKSIDATGDARKEYEQSISRLGEDIADVRGMLPAENPKPSLMSVHKSFDSPVPDILQSMGENAQDMAHNLESLVKHFDICVTAIKHTEGGGAAAQKMTIDLPEGVGLDLDNVDTPVEPMGEEEMRDMLEVLQKDAGEVEDVVMEIKDRIADMDTEFERVLAYNDHLSEIFARTTAAVKLLEESADNLSIYISQSHTFLLRWDDEKAKIEKGMAQLEELRVFYDGFLLAYDNLIIEVGRRKNVDMRMAKIRQDALAKIERLHEEDIAERDAFKQEQGAFLPMDIWPGLMAAPKRYEISAVDGGAGSVPDISASVIQKAIRRVGKRNNESVQKA